MTTRHNLLRTLASRRPSIPRLTFLLAAVLLLLPRVAASQALAQNSGAPSPGDFRSVRIALSTGERHIVFGAKGKYRVKDGLGEQVGTLSSRRLYFVDVMDDGYLSVRDSRGKSIVSGKYDLRFVPYSDAKSSLNFQSIRHLNSWEASQLEKAPSYRGDMQVMLNPEGLITVINHVGLEDYVAGVVGPEMGNDAPLEALRAQAVAARSEAMAKIMRAKGNIDRHYDFGDTSADQRYTGRAEINDAVLAAVSTTEGVVMMWENSPIDAVYSHSCGGITVDKTELWGGTPEPYLRRQRDYIAGPAAPDLSNQGDAYDIVTREIQSLCNPHQDGFPVYARDNFRWRVTLTAQQLRDIIDPVYGTGQIRDVDVRGRSASGRVTKLRVSGMDKTVNFRKELDIRWALGDLKSTFFTYRIWRSSTGRLETIDIAGAGFGHGVGMCQMGALMMATRGQKAREILKHYYPGVEFKRLRKS